MVGIGCAALGVFLFGRILPGYFLVRIWLRKDVTKEGSGNCGASNVRQVVTKYKGKKAGIGAYAVVLLLDAGKGFLPCYLAWQYLEGNTHLAFAVVVVAGSVFSLLHCCITHGQQLGGKGVATSLGVLAAVSLPSSLMVALAIVVFQKVLEKAFDRVSSASLSAVCAAFLVVFYLYGEEVGLWLLPIVILIFFSHRQNIVRLINRSEPTKKERLGYE